MRAGPAADTPKTSGVRGSLAPRCQRIEERLLDQLSSPSERRTTRFDAASAISRGVTGRWESSSARERQTEFGVLAIHDDDALRVAADIRTTSKQARIQQQPAEGPFGTRLRRLRDTQLRPG